MILPTKKELRKARRRNLERWSDYLDLDSTGKVPELREQLRAKVEGLEKDIVLLVSSNHPPYWRDIPEILARESGAGFHFRYREKWVPKEISDDPDSLIDQDALILHLDGPANDYEYVPIRHAQIFNTERFGEHIRVEFRLKEFVGYPGSDQDILDFRARIDEAVKEANRRRRRNNQVSLDLGYEGHFVLPCRMVPFESSRGRRNWSLIVRQLARFQTFDHTSADQYPPTIFLYASLRRRWRIVPNLRRILLLPPKDLAALDYDHAGRLMLKSGRRYYLHLLQYVPSIDINDRELEIDAEEFPVKLKLESDEEVIRPTIAETTIRGKYDDSYLAFECQPRSRTTRSFLQLNADSDYFNVPNIRFHDIIVERSWTLWVQSALVVFLFLMAGLFPVIVAWLEGLGLSIPVQIGALIPLLPGILLSLAGLLLVFLRANIR